MKTNHNIYIITGGPGAGKTTLLEELKRRNYNYIPEIARKIIAQQIARGGNALPWKNTSEYIRIMLSQSIESYLENENNKKLLFSDRGIPDTLAYAKLIHHPETSEFTTIANSHRYNRNVFILPPWKEIYTTDSERKQSFEEATHTYHILTETYRQLDYNIIEIPKLPVTQRADIVINTIKATNTPCP